MSSSISVRDRDSKSVLMHELNHQYGTRDYYHEFADIQVSSITSVDIQLYNDDYRIITRESLERIGEGVNALWDYCWNKSAGAKFGRFVKWGEDNEKG